MKGNILLFVTLILLILSTLLTSMSLLITMRLDLVMLKKDTNATYDITRDIVEEYAKRIQQEFNQKLYQYISLELTPRVIQESINMEQDEQDIQTYCYQMIKKQYYDPFIQYYLNKGPVKIKLDDIEMTLNITNLNRKNIKLENQFYILGNCVKEIDLDTQSEYTIEVAMRLHLPPLIPSQVYQQYNLLNESKPDYLDYALWIDGPILLEDRDSLNVIGGLWTREPIVTLEQIESGIELVERSSLNQESLINLELDSHEWCYETPIEIDKTEIRLSDYYVTEEIEEPYTTLIINPNSQQTLKIYADDAHSLFRGWILSKGPIEIEDKVIIEGGIIAPSLTVHQQATVIYSIDKLLSLMPYDQKLYDTILEKLGIMNVLSNSIESYFKININDIALEIEYIKLKS